MKLQPTNHAYYCSENNYHVGNHYGENFGRGEFDTWHDFKAEWLTVGFDKDLNLLFRFDILPHDSGNGHSLWLFFIQQRQGNYLPIRINNLKEEDMSEVETFLKESWQYLKKLWSEME